MEINIVPLGTKTPSVSKYIADSLKELELAVDILIFVHFLTYL